MTYYIQYAIFNDFNSGLFISLQPTDKPFRILHITDIHFDELYEIGSLADCGMPCCCGNNQGKPSNPADGAGAWGDYRSCDTPWHAVLDLMNRTSQDVSIPRFGHFILAQAKW